MIELIISSPPFVDCGLGSSCKVALNKQVVRNRAANIRPGECAANITYGGAKGQIGAMKAGTLAAVIGSPPYAGSDQDYASGWKYIDPAKSVHNRYSRNREASYGYTTGQIGRMKTGQLETKGTTTKPTQIKTSTWEGCYEEKWQNMIVPLAISHPAKFSKNLIERIVDYCLSQGWVAPNSTVGDPFGGVGLGGLVCAYRKLRWVGCELEPRFFRMAQGYDCAGVRPAVWANHKGKGEAFPHYQDLCPACQDAVKPESKTEPRFSRHHFTGNFDLHRDKWARLGCPELIMRCGDSRGFHKLFQADTIASSPPFAGTVATQDPNFLTPGERGKHNPTKSNQPSYGTTPGQIGALRAGKLDSVMSSPPFSAPGQQPQIGQGHRKQKGEQGTNRQAQRTPGNIEALPPGELSAVVSSPPYASADLGGGGILSRECAKRGKDNAMGVALKDEDYGSTPGQLAALQIGKVDGVISSPPFEKCNLTTDRKFMAKVERDQRNGSRLQPDIGSYGKTVGQIGNTQGQTYWEAMRDVFSSCLLALKPGGYACWVVKDYISKGKRVRLCDDTLRLLVHLGYEPVERIRAMLVKESREPSLFGGDVVKTTSRSSFFRKIYEKKLPPGDERRLLWEEVIIVRKPLTAGCDKLLRPVQPTKKKGKPCK